MVNAGDEDVPFVVQDAHADAPWHVVVDTALPAPADIEVDRPPLLERPSYKVGAHSVVVLVR